MWLPDVPRALAAKRCPMAIASAHLAGSRDNGTLKIIADVIINRVDGTIVIRRGTLGGMIAEQRGICKKADKPNM